MLVGDKRKKEKPPGKNLPTDAKGGGVETDMGDDDMI